MGAEPLAASSAAQATKKVKISEPKKVKVAPAYPSYLQMSAEAIGALKERTGSSQLAIAKWIEGKYAGVLPANFKKQLSLQLKKLSQKGKLVQIKHSYKLSDELKKPAKVVKKVAEKKPSVGKKVVKAVKSPKKAVKKTVTKSGSAAIKPAKKTTINPKKDAKAVSKVSAVIDVKKTSAPTKKPVEKKAVKATVTAAKKPPVSKKTVAKKVSTASKKVAKVKSPVAKKSKASS